MLTIGGVLPEDPEAWGYKARTDTKLDVISKAKWFRFPYPCKINEYSHTITTYSLVKMECKPIMWSIYVTPLHHVGHTLGIIKISAEICIHDVLLKVMFYHVLRES